MVCVWCSMQRANPGALTELDTGFFLLYEFPLYFDNQRCWGIKKNETRKTNAKTNP